MRTEAQTLAVSEIFYSIQGESTAAGLPCLFIRLAGCNLACCYCDTRYATSEPPTAYGLDELMRRTRRYPGALVEVTGGEPLLQPEVYPLLHALLAEQRTVLLETNGSLSLARVPPAVVKIMDLKCPSSGMSGQMQLENLDLLATHDEIKFVIGTREDYEWARQMVGKHQLAKRAKILMSPIVETLEPSLLAEWILADEIPARLQLQLHRILWPRRLRGV